ncbi:MAG: DUF11 domain-containing protein [Dokdonella sp.]|uniref:DUF11 domain-containing protein n=1 Tax=Dokdonella sp. TaxID=2291710 RepID=UPI003267562C
MRSTIWLGFLLTVSRAAAANEITVKNDSLTDFGPAVIVQGFVAGEMAGSWLTSPCDGNLVAVQIFWRSASGTQPFVIGNAINIYRSGVFPVPGDLALSVGGPVMNDNALNEFRYQDENNTLPINVPVTTNETVVVAYEFSEAQQSSDPSVVRDTDGIQPNRNSIYGDNGAGPAWYSSSDLLVLGDWVIRAVVNCQTASSAANVSTSLTSVPGAYVPGGTLQYTITIGNSGPASAPGTTVVDTFSSAFTGITWVCAPSGGASCTTSGSGNIIDTANLPSGSQAVYTVNGTVGANANGTLSNSATAVVHAPVTDPDSTNNTASLDLEPAVSDMIFADGFENSIIVVGTLKPMASRLSSSAK